MHMTQKNLSMKEKWASQVATVVRNPSANARNQISAVGREDTLGKELATHSSILAWRIPWTEEPGGLQSMDSQRVGHN